MSIRVDKEFESLIPPLTPDEFKQLEENILKDGIRDPLIVWPQESGDDILIDGHNRWKISANHSGIPFNILRKGFKDRDEAKQWIILNQFGRRNLSAYDRSILALKLKPIIAEQAKENQKLGGKGSQKSVNHKADTQKELATIAGVSHDTIHKVETIEKSGDEEVKQAVRSGEISINQAYRDIKGLNTKSPRQLHKEIIEDAKREREDFKEKMSDGVVSVKEAAQDRENAEMLASELWSRIAKMGKGITEMYVDIKEDEVDIHEMVEVLPESEIASLINRIQMWKSQLDIILKEMTN